MSNSGGNLGIALSPADFGPDTASDTGSSPGIADPSQPDDADPLGAMFNELDTDNKGTIGLKELRRAVARFVGQRDVSEADCLDTLERLNAIQPPNQKIDPKNITIIDFQKILDAIDPNDFAVQARLKEWFTSLGILDAFAQEMEKFVRRDGVDHKDILLEASKLSNVQVVDMCDGFRQRVGPIMAEAVQRLKTMSTPLYSAVSANNKFAMMDDAFTGSFAEVEEFFKGLDGHIGLPSPRVLFMMELEHTGSADSHDDFITSNYGGTETNPALEWEFVMTPDPNKQYPGIMRVPQPLDHFLNHETALQAGLEKPEIIALRLFTGPMFMKYNAKLRNFPQDGVEALKGNGYVTTIHAIVSAVIKLSRIWKLPHDRKVYRGLGGMLLPEKFWKEDQFGCRGGVELALMSTTIKRDVAIQYSGTEKGRPTIFEIEVGQVDRGASLSWVSQYPMEEEIVMPPLSNLEVVGDARMEESKHGLVMVIPLRINVNLKSLTMDELKERRKLLHLSMMDNLWQEAQRDLMEEVTRHHPDDPAATAAAASSGQNPADQQQEQVRQMLSDFNELMDKVRGMDSIWFNDDDNYKNAMTSALDMKRGTLRKFQELHSERMRVVSDEVQRRIRESNCSDWARDGTVFRIISNTYSFPWEAVAEGKLTEVELQPTLSREQASVAWDAIKANLHGSRTAGTAPVKHVTIRGLEGKVVKIRAADAIDGLTFSLKAERIGAGNSRTTESHGVGPEGIRLLLPIFAMNMHFVRVDLSKSNIGVDLAHQLGQLLARNKELKFLKIRGPIQVDRARSQEMLDMSSRNSRAAANGPLTRRVMSRTGFNSSFSGRASAGQGSGTPTMRRTGTLTRGSRLTMGKEAWEPCDVEGGIVLAAFLEHNSCMTKLDLEGNRIGPEGATALATTLPKVRQLRFLNLRDNNICAQGATAISQALVVHQDLVHLDIRDNRTGASGPAQLAPAIHANERLQDLNAVEIGEVAGEGRGAGCWKVSSLTDPAYEMVFVARRIMNMEQVTSLDFTESQLGYEGARLLQPALMSCVNLQHLCLRGTALRSEGGREIAPAFAACVNLQTLDLSYNLIDQDDATREMAASLKDHPSLTSLIYIGNIKEGFIEWELCVPRWRQPYKVLCQAVPRCTVTFFTKEQQMKGLLSWCWITLSVAALFVGLIGTPIALSANQYIYAFGIMGIWVSGLLAAGAWVVSRRLLRRLGIINCFVRMVQQCQCAWCGSCVRLVELQHHTADANSGSSRWGGEMDRDGANADVVYATSPDPRQRNGTAAVSAENAEMVPVRVYSNGEGRRNILSNGGNGEIGHEEDGEGDDPQDEPNELQNIQNMLGEGLIMQVPMLLEQFVSNTIDPASLDQELAKESQFKQDNWTVGQFVHSSKPIALALHKTSVKALIFLCVLYYATVFFIFFWPWMFPDDITYRTFRFDAVQYRNGLPATNVYIDSFAVGGYYCERAFNGTAFFSDNNSVVLEFEDLVTIGRWRVISGTQDPELDPTTFQLLGCVERYALCQEWEDITGNQTDPEFPMERLAEVWYDVEEFWQLTLLRFVPLVFGLGFLSLLYCSMANRHEYGKSVLITTFSTAALMYVIASTPNSNIDERMRWVSGGCLVFFPAMIGWHERYFIHGIVLYGLIYCPMVLILFRGIYEDTTLPQWSRYLNWKNYDQLTVMPIFVITCYFMLLPLLALYGLYRAQIKLLVERDIDAYTQAWDLLKKEVPEALRDLKGEVDKFSNAIEQRNLTVVRHTVGNRKELTGAEAEDEQEASRRPSLFSLFRDRRRNGELSEAKNISSLFQVYAQAGGVELLLRHKVQSWAVLSKGSFPTSSGALVAWARAKEEPRLQRSIVWGELKDRSRSIEKVLRFYDSDVSKVLDICRQMIVFENIEDLSHCVAVIRQDNEVQVVRVKNRMDPDVDSVKVYAGYRDVALNLKFKTEEAETLGVDGHVCEVRLVYKDLAAMLQGREGLERHKRYIEYRNSRGS